MLGAFERAFYPGREEVPRGEHPPAAAFPRPGKGVFAVPDFYFAQIERPDVLRESEGRAAVAVRGEKPVSFLFCFIQYLFSVVPVGRGSREPSTVQNLRLGGPEGPLLLFSALGKNTGTFSVFSFPYLLISFYPPYTGRYLSENSEPEQGAGTPPVLLRVVLGVCNLWHPSVCRQHNWLLILRVVRFGILWHTVRKLSQNL